jgi:hypothetical protein
MLHLFSELSGSVSESLVSSSYRLFGIGGTTTRTLFSGKCWGLCSFAMTLRAGGPASALEGPASVFACIEGPSDVLLSSSKGHFAPATDVIS